MSIDFRASEVQSLDHPGHASALGRSRLAQRFPQSVGRVEVEQRLNARPHVVDKSTSARPRQMGAADPEPEPLARTPGPVVN